jgi:hypothetical protein
MRHISSREEVRLLKLNLLPEKLLLLTRSLVEIYEHTLIKMPVVEKPVTDFLR